MAVVDILQASLTPVIAVVTTYIAYNQYRIRRDEQRLALYDRRLRLYERAIEIVDITRSGNTYKTERAFSWLNSVHEADFLFGEEVRFVIDELFGVVFEYAALCESSSDFNVTLAGLACQIENHRTPLIIAFTPYLQPVGSPWKRKKRLTLKKMKVELKLCTESTASAFRRDEDIPF